MKRFIMGELSIIAVAYCLLSPVRNFSSQHFFLQVADRKAATNSIFVFLWWKSDIAALNADQDNERYQFLC